MTIRNVTLVGGNGTLGTVILNGLVSAGTFRVTVLKRSSSKSTLSHADKIRVVEIPDDLSVDSVAEKLKGEDALVVSIPVSDPEEHIRLAEAAAAAGVKRIIPADFGSVDSRGKRERELVQLFEKKVRVRERLEQLAAENENFTWTSLVCGHFFDWGLKANFLHFNLEKKKAEIIDDGNKKSSLSTLARIAEATVSILHRYDVTKNKMLFVQSFCVSQNECLESLKKVTGNDWTVEHLDSEEFIKKYKALADGGDKAAIEELVFVLGAIDGNWEPRDEFGMSLLGLENEDLDTVVKRVVEST
ncbi:putative -like family protein [Phaeoacremonium minimum UCRPA7]|uniref:Putative-like family protein n=1 Tax=Phaeoacremonium minimum (strain UCR-PA7) TaxID=1286976 RepID=R8BUV6_PHAM7|nr:putative -like family protein [Phaeoacremonium minimum UCRPA7]EOO03148.1 putative -like family protein [Phaeoacremonium minimum UCRPA7]